MKRYCTVGIFIASPTLSWFPIISIYHGKGTSYPYDGGSQNLYSVPRDNGDTCQTKSCTVTHVSKRHLVRCAKCQYGDVRDDKLYIIRPVIMDTCPMTSHTVRHESDEKVYSMETVNKNTCLIKICSLCHVSVWKRFMSKLHIIPCADFDTCELKVSTSRHL